MVVQLDGFSERQRQSWRGLLDVAAVVPDAWCLVGGQMVFLICQERQFTPARPTDDGDVVLDVRAHPLVLHEFTAALTRVGFSPAGETQEGHQHRWVRDLASIDVLIPQGLGRAATVKRGVTGATTLSSPGAQQAIRRAEPVGVQVDQTEGTVHRPNLIGALVSKAAAHSVPGDPNKARHIIDFAALAAMARRSDRIAQQLSAGDRKHLAPMLTALAASRPLWSSTPGAERGVLALTRFAGQEIK